MSSGEVLFILAFIVLPTAVLVSSAWAILFVRRRPERVVEYVDVERAGADVNASDRYDIVVDTLVLPTVERADVVRLAEPDLDDDSDTPAQELELDEASQTDDTPVIGPTMSDLSAPDTSEDRIDSLEEAEPRKPADSTVEDDSEYMQATDDLNAVVAEVVASDAQDEQSPLHPDEEDADDEDTDIYETSDLPVLEPRDEPENESQTRPERAVEPDDRNGDGTPETDQTEPESRWRRRKRPAPLRPGDPEAARTRGRSRDPQRQVPQLGRSARKRDGSSRDTDMETDDSP